MWKALAINLSNIQGLMCAVIVRRLRDHKWPPKQIEQIARKALDRCEAALKDDDRLQSVAQDAAMMHARGTEDATIQEMASAAFVICAVGIADDLNRSRVAEWN